MGQRLLHVLEPVRNRRWNSTVTGSVRGLFSALLLLTACSSAAPEPASSASPEGTPSSAGPSAPSTTPAVASAPRKAAPVVESPVTPAPSATTPAARAPAPASAPAPSPTAEAAPDPFGPLARKLRRLTPDPAPEHTTNDKHYLVSNERRHDLFRPELDETGGVMLGVGSDQSYVMAPWAKTELLVIVDFDQKVVDLHSVHGALMAASPTVEEFRRLWSPEGMDDAHAVLREGFSGSTRTERLELYDQAQEWVDKRLRRLAKRYEELGVHSYLDTPEQYQYVVDLHARGRVVALRGDWTQDGVLREVSETLEAHGQPVKVLYLSNIEQYFSYRKPFKQNMRQLPFDDTVVLRTLPGRPAGFHYILQSGEDFKAWMRAPKVWSVYRIRGLVKGEPLEANKRFVAGPPPDEREG